MERSAGILVYRCRDLGVEVLLGHMGGPYWANKDDGAWSIPKGIVDPTDQDELAAAYREFEEEMGIEVPPGTPHDLGDFRQRSNKHIHIWALEGDLDATTCVSGMFTMEWPPRSGKMRSYPEIDRAHWWSIDDASQRIVKGQRAVLDRLCSLLSTNF